MRVSVPPSGPVDSSKLAFDVCSLIERKPAAKAFGLAGRAIRELRIGMQARYLRIRPGAVARFPRRENPALAVRRATGHVRTGQDLVVVGLLAEVFRAFQHDAILHPQ